MIVRDEKTGQGKEDMPRLPTGGILDSLLALNYEDPIIAFCKKMNNICKPMRGSNWRLCHVHLHQYTNRCVSVYVIVDFFAILLIIIWSSLHVLKIIIHI